MISNRILNNTWLSLVGIFLLAACGNNAKKQSIRNVWEETANLQQEGVETRQLDDMFVTWIQDNAGENRMPRTLFADASDALIDSLGLQDGIPSTISTFWVERGGTGILFDTGLGQPESRLIDGLASAGVEPGDVEYLFLTHFHGDHVGGMIRDDTLVFPKAEVYASRVEYDAWMQMPEERKAQAVKIMEAYKSQLHFFEYGDTLPGGIVAMNARGHTPGHTVFRAGKLLIIGDLMHGMALQMEHPEICAAYDMDKKAAIESRIRILEYARKNGLTMAGMHLPAPAFAK